MRKRTVHVQFWLNEKEAAKLAAGCKRSGLSQAAYLRHLIQGRTPQSIPPPETMGLLEELSAIRMSLPSESDAAQRLDAVTRQLADCLWTLRKES